ncbi:MAG: tetratricopeptide repeat protein [Bacilli bacterium]
MTTWNEHVFQAIEAKQWEMLVTLFEENELEGTTKDEVAASVVVMLMSAGRTEEAQSILQKLTTVWPKFGRGHYLLGSLYYNRGVYADAYLQFVEAQAKGFVSSELHFYTGVCAYQMGSYQRALAFLMTATNLTEELKAEHAFYTGLSWLKIGRVSEGKRALEEAIAHHPRHADALYNLGVVLETEGNEIDAKALWSRVLSIEPEHLLAKAKLHSEPNREV